MIGHNQVPLEEPMVVAKYIDNPLLINGHKSDLRYMVLGDSKVLLKTRYPVPAQFLGNCSVQPLLGSWYWVVANVLYTCKVEPVL